MSGGMHMNQAALEAVLHGAGVHIRSLGVICNIFRIFGMRPQRSRFIDKISCFSASNIIERHWHIREKYVNRAAS